MSDSNPDRTAAAALWLVPLLGACCLACAAQLPTIPEPEPPAAGTLRVQLFFGAGADLDLYVTDPRQETVYFANTPSASGGALESDLRCGDPAERIERVRFTDPPPGRYRVGIDYPERCGARRGPAPYRVVVEGPDLRREVRGEIDLGHFQMVVLEMEVGR